MTDSRLFPIGEAETAATSDGWYTPRWIFDGLGIMFDLDVCAPADGPVHVPCRKWYSENDDGLAQPWEGTVWCNPPYSAPTRWCDRYADHADGLILIRADLSTGGPYRAFAASHAVYVAARRISFLNNTAGASVTSTVNFSTVLLARGAECVAGLFRLAERTRGVTRRLVRDGS